MPNNWELVQQIDAGASRQTCQMGGAKHPHDSRRYGSALQQEGYPLIQRWVEGDRAADAEAECLQFLRDGISRGSLPMLAVAGIALKQTVERNVHLMRSLSLPERQRLAQLLKIAIAVGDWDTHLRGWEVALPDQPDQLGSIAA
jgi:hypothetical protein